MDVLTRLVLYFFSLQALCCPVSCAEWEAEVIKKIEVLTTSCVVIPCSFEYPGVQKSHSQLRGIWYSGNARDKFIYHEDDTKIVENFKGRTKMVGDLGSKNCTLEIVEFKNHDAGPYCFRIEIPGGENFSYKDNCAQVFVTEKPEEPKLHYREKAYEGSPYAITCSVIHTCPSHMPELTWSRGGKEEVTTHYKSIGEGKWEVQSLLTFVPNEHDDDADITCAANFYGGMNSESKMNLRVKRELFYMYQNWGASCFRQCECVFKLEVIKHTVS
uniref:Ig-like domain-containing protein n=1 Tax=Scleropages formosus TaxID=113540 RepID=A0A8C9WFA6_SCLFO